MAEGEAYLSDHFAFRPPLIFALAWLKLKLGASSTPAVTLGKRGWMFLTDLDDWRGMTRPQPAAITDWKSKYLQRQRWIEQHGAHFLFVVGPCKETVYPEYLPDYARPLSDQTRRRQFLGAMQGSGMDILDLTDAMLAAKPAGQLYYKYDTHWNFLGAYFAARSIIDYLHANHPNVPQFADTSFIREPRVAETQAHADTGWFNLGVRLGVPFLSEDDTVISHAGGWTTKLQVNIERRRMVVYTFTKDDPSLPTLVVYADSYGYPLKRMIAEHFRRAVFINPFEDESEPADEFPTGIVERERPDYFIYLRWESGAFSPIGNPPEVR